MESVQTTVASSNEQTGMPMQYPEPSRGGASSPCVNAEASAPLQGDKSLIKSREGKRDATRSTKNPESSYEKAQQAKSGFTTQITSTRVHASILAGHYSPCSNLSSFRMLDQCQLAKG